MSSPPIPLIAPPTNPPPIYFSAGAGAGFPTSKPAASKAEPTAEAEPTPEAPPSALRLLLLGAPKSGKLTFLQQLTSSLPSSIPPAPHPHAGLSHTYAIKTPYYNANVPIWIDEFPLDTTELETWRKDFLSEEAKEVREVLGGVVYVFREDRVLEEVEREVKVVGDLVRKLGWDWGGSGDGVAFVIRMPKRGDEADVEEEKAEVEDGEGEKKVAEEQPKTKSPQKTVAETEDWKELLEPKEGGWEVIDFKETERDDYGDTTGMERLREGLEANDWNGGMFKPGIAGIDDGEDFDIDGMDEGPWDEKLLEEEMKEFKKGLLGGEKTFEEMSAEEQEGEIERFEAMVLRLQGMKMKGTG